MKTLKEVTSTRGEKYPQISLSKLAGSEVVDVEGYVSNEFGEPVFKITRIILKDGRNSFVGAEHDAAYIEDIDTPLVSQEQLQFLYDEEN